MRMQPLPNAPTRDPARPRQKFYIDRREWVLEALREGKTHREIGSKLRLTVERVRQIAKEALEGYRVEPTRDHSHLQIARLRPALRTAADAVVRGDVKAVYPLVKILEKLDAYQAKVVKLDVPAEDPEARASVKMFNDKIQMIKEHYNRMGLVEQVQTLAQAYALAELEKEHMEAKAKAAEAEAEEQAAEAETSANETETPDA